MTGLRRILLSGAIALAFGAGVSHAQSAVVRLEAIEAQPLSGALEDFIERTGLQLVYVSEIAVGRRSKGSRAGLSAEEVLRELLRDTGLTFEFLNDRTVSIRPLSSAQNADNAARAPLQGATPAASSPGATRGEKQGEAPVPAADKTTSTTVAIPDMLVVGSRILNADIQRTEDDAQPYIVFNRADLERSGARNVEDFLARRLTASTSFSTANQNGNGFLGNTSSIDLRGLGQDETLILVDGRRMAGFSVEGTPAQPDVNGIPLAAIERIEVLPATASGIYGGGATGGVINIVLRRDYDGVDVKLTYGSTFDGGADQSQVDLSAGFALEEGRTSILLAASYSDADALRVEERDFLQRGHQRFLVNNPSLLLGAQPPLGATTNISSIGFPRPNLTLVGGTPLNAPVTFVPPGYAGPASDNGAGLVANAGQYNLQLADTANGTRRGLVYTPTVKSFIGSARREFTSWLDAYLELATADNEASVLRGLAGTLIIPGGSPGNPFQETIAVTTPLFGTDFSVDSSVRTDRAAAGLIVDLPRQWRAQADYTRSKTRFFFRQPLALLDTGAAAGDVASGTLDIFRDTNASPIDFSPYAIVGNETLARTTLDNPALRFSGPLPLALPGGPPTASLLLEYRKEEIDAQTAPTSIPGVDIFSPGRSRTVNSAYLELRLPILVAGNAVPGIDLLELQLAGRWDEYKTIGKPDSVLRLNGVPLTPIVRETNTLDSVNPTFGVRYKPIADLMLRASYGTGFLPPSVSQLVESAPQPLFPFLGLTDPRRGDEPIALPGRTVLVTSGGNPDLDPEESESWSAGLVLTPQFIPGLRVSADWTRIDKTDNVGVVFLNQSNLSLEQLIPGLVTRDTNPATFGAFGVGPIIAIDQRLRNIAVTEVEAYDLAVDYRWATERFGEFTLSTAATHFAHNKSQAVPLAPVVDSAGTVRGLKLRGNAALSWDYQNWTAAWTTRYFDSYRLFPADIEDEPFSVAFITAQGSASVPSQTYHDVFASFRFNSQTGLLSGAEIQLGVNNIFNTRPPVDLTNSGLFYSFLGDPRLASYYVSLRKAF